MNWFGRKLVANNNSQMQKWRTLWIAVGITMLALLLAGSAGAATITVNASGGADYLRIQDAIDNATAGDTIEVHGGTYYENVNVNRQLNLTGIGSPIVDAGGSGNAIIISSSGTTLEGFIVVNGSAGIYLSGWDFGNNIIRNNNARLNGRGFDLQSSYNILNDNNASNNDEGIHLVNTCNNRVINNIMMENNYNFVLELDIYYEDPCGNTIDTSNLVDGKPIYYIEGAEDNVYDSSINAGTFYCISCVNVTIQDMNLSNNGAGIYFWKTRNSRIQNVNTSNNKDGIYLLSSNGNTVNDNNAWNNANNGILIESEKSWLPSTDNTLNNNFVSNNDIGIQLTGNCIGYMSKSITELTTLRHNTVSNNNYGFLLDCASRTTLISNKAIDNNNSGIYIGMLEEPEGCYYDFWPCTESFGNLIYNNYFSNVNNANDKGNNIWNTTKASGINIIGGSYLGGNVWANPGSTGFSQTCPDSNIDGICDLPYTLDSNNIDNLPLANPPASITSWGNSKTNNNNLTLIANKSEIIRFNATANQPITTWRWYKDNVYQSNNYNNFSTSWAAEGSYTIKVNTTNPNGTGNTITWYVGINPAKIGKNGAPWNGFSAMEHTTEDKGRPGIAMIGLFRDSFEDNDYDWTVSYGNISVVNGKLQAYGNINASLSRNIGNHTNVSNSRYS